MRTPRPRTGFSAATVVALLIPLVLAGCANSQKDSRYTKFPSGVKNRPTVNMSAAEMHVTSAAIEPVGGPGLSELNFFDELATRDEVVNDDALHACLLLGTGVSLPTYDDRVAVAKRLAWIKPRWPARPPREAATLGEVSRILVRMMGDKRKVSPARATERLQTMGLLPQETRHYQGLTGAQLITLLGQVEEALGPADLATIRKSARDNWYQQAVVDDSDGDEPALAASPAPAQPAPTQPAPVAQSAPTAQAQPQQPAAEQPRVVRKPVVAPDPETSRPAAEPASKPGQPASPWRRGTPLRKPGA